MKGMVIWRCSIVVIVIGVDSSSCDVDFLRDISSLGEGMVGHRRLVFTCILYRKLHLNHVLNLEF